MLLKIFDTLWQNRKGFFEKKFYYAKHDTCGWVHAFLRRKNMHDANVMMENLMYCYAYDACMHDTRNIIWHTMLKNVWPTMTKCMHKKSWRQGKQVSKLIRFFLFSNFCLLIRSHYPNHFLFKRTFCVKKNFFFIFNTVFSLTTTIYYRHVNFFANFSLNTKNIFFLKKTNKTLDFSIFVFYSK